MRKPISVAITNRTEFDPFACVVVCDDGSIWEISNGSWERYPDIPQDVYDDLPQMLIEQN